MIELVLIVAGFLLGVLLFPLLLFLRARRSPGWDTSNIFNIYRVIGHLAIRPEDFGHMQYSDQSRPFWYIGEDEFSGVVKTNRVNRVGSDRVGYDGRNHLILLDTADLTAQQVVEQMDRIREFLDQD